MLLWYRLMMLIMGAISVPFAETQDFEAEHHVMKSMLVRLPDPGEPVGGHLQSSQWGFFGQRSWCHLGLEILSLHSHSYYHSYYHSYNHSQSTSPVNAWINWSFLLKLRVACELREECAEFLPDCSVELVKTEAHSASCVEGAGGTCALHRHPLINPFRSHKDEHIMKQFIKS